MTIKRGILCEILCTDDRFGAPTSIIGRIEEFQLEQFNDDNQSNFICFIESYIPSVLKTNISEITVYNDEDGIPYIIEDGKLDFSMSSLDLPKIKSKAEVIL